MSSIRFSLSLVALFSSLFLGADADPIKLCLLGLTGTKKGSETGRIGADALRELARLAPEETLTASILSRRGKETVDLSYSDLTGVNIEAVQGSIFNPDDVAKACQDAKIAIFSSPYGTDTSGQAETESIKQILEGLETAKVPNLLLTCAQVLTSTSDDGPMMFDREIKDLVVSQVSAQDSAFRDYAIIQTGSWTDTAFDRSIDMIKNMGIFIGNGIPKPLCYTSQDDIGVVTGRVAAQMLGEGPIPHHEFDLYDPKMYTGDEILAIASDVADKELWGISSFLYRFVAALQPVFVWFGNGRGVHLSKLFKHLLKYGYVPDEPSAAANQKAVLDLGFTPTTLREYFEKKLGSSGAPENEEL